MLLYHNDFGYLEEIVSRHSETFLLMDDNTFKYCLPIFLEMTRVRDFIPVVIRPGEPSKSLDTVSDVWQCLVEHYADRNTLIINLGGGVVSDIGGFAASCYQRGVDFVNVPTSLLSMVDASIGGKTGIDFCGLKNQIGTFCEPAAVMIAPEFLDTLPTEQMLSGLGELAKYGFITNRLRLEPSLPLDFELVRNAAEFKMEITSVDSKDNGVRRVLNFGHTAGHALESILSCSPAQLLHGEAVALGIIPALFLSNRYRGLDITHLINYRRYYYRLFRKINLENINLGKLLDIMRHDKKNIDGKIRFVLLEGIGCPVTDVVVTDDDIIDSLCYLIDSMRDEGFGQ